MSRVDYKDPRRLALAEETGPGCCDAMWDCLLNDQAIDDEWLQPRLVVSVDDSSLRRATNTEENLSVAGQAGQLNSDGSSYDRRRLGPKKKYRKRKSTRKAESKHTKHENVVPQPPNIDTLSLPGSPSIDEADGAQSTADPSQVAVQTQPPTKTKKKTRKSPSDVDKKTEATLESQNSRVAHKDPLGSLSHSDSLVPKENDTPQRSKGSTSKSAGEKNEEPAQHDTSKIPDDTSTKLLVKPQNMVKSQRPISVPPSARDGSLDNQVPRESAKAASKSRKMADKDPDASNKGEAHARARSTPARRKPKPLDAPGESTETAKSSRRFLIGSSDFEARMTEEPRDQRKTIPAENVESRHEKDYALVGYQTAQRASAALGVERNKSQPTDSPKKPVDPPDEQTIERLGTFEKPIRLDDENFTPAADQETVPKRHDKKKSLPDRKEHHHFSDDTKHANDITQMNETERERRRRERKLAIARINSLRTKLEMSAV